MFDNKTYNNVKNIKSIKGEELCLDLEDGIKILFLLKGKITYNLDGYIKNLNGKYCVLLPSNGKCTIRTEENAEMVIMDLYKKMNFCHHFSIEMLYNLNKEKISDTRACHLKINEVLFDFLLHLIKTIDSGLLCGHFYELKQKEVLFYLRAYYSKQELFCFFSSVLNDDMAFANLIYKNYNPEINVQKLAEKTNYSLSGFKSKFTKVFGIPPYEWITREKAKSIHYDINCTKMTFKEIALQYSFSSQAHFSKFCKNTFGDTPTEMRAKSINKQII